MDCSNAETELARHRDGNSRDRAWALEVLLNLLLQGVESSSYSTDGVILLRERTSATEYSAVATVFLLAEGIEPAAFSFGFDEGSQVVTGRVNFGLMTEHFPRGVNSRSKLQNYLQAFPDDIVSSLHWQFKFERHVGGWQRV